MRYNVDTVLTRFTAWLADAKAHSGIAEPTAMCVATCVDAIPSARIVLLKAYDARGFVFYTNMESRKSHELRANPHAALCFHWMPLERQIRVEGIAEGVSDAEADAYFASRPRASQLGAWASQQSQPLPSREALLQRLEEVRQRYEGQAIPRPPQWSGWRIVPQRVEFWQQGQARLHEREVFTRQPKGWTRGYLYP